MPVIFHRLWVSASIETWQPRNRLRADGTQLLRLAPEKHKLPGRRICGSSMLASKRPSLARKSRSAFLRRSSTPSADAWRLSRSGRPEMSDATPSANTCSIEWKGGISLRPWQSNSTDGSGADLRLRILKTRQTAGTNSLVPSQFAAKGSASRRCLRFMRRASRDEAASI